MQKAAVIVAGGKGTRMGGPISKQYLSIGGKPVLMHTLEKFHQADPSTFLILVLPEADFLFWEKLCRDFNFSLPHRVIAGGNSRFQSVKNGLDAVSHQRGLVAIHDAVRPFVSIDVINQSFAQAEKTGSAIAFVDLKDSIRKVEENGVSTFQERHLYRLVQTPQTFLVDKIKLAFQVEDSPKFTDDATVYENQGWEVTLIPGNPENIKITTPEDLEYADFILSREK